MARVPARRRHGDARERLDPETGDRLHAREHGPRGEQHRERGGPLHRLAGTGARLQGRPARDPAAPRRRGEAARSTVRSPRLPRRGPRERRGVPADPPHGDRWIHRGGLAVTRSEELFAPVTDVAASLTSFPHPWFISGGWAIDLFLNRVTLRHFRSSLPP